MAQVTGQKVVVGLGKTGMSCLEFLVQQGMPVAVTDSREQPPSLAQLQSQFPQISAQLGKFDLNFLLAAQELIVSPGVPLSDPVIAQCIAAGIPAIGDIELFARYVTAPVIAITGTNGKSTVTTLLSAMLKDAGKKVKVGGNLGMPALDLLGDSSTEFYVLELSSFQLETTFSLKPKAAAVLNIAPDHLDRYHCIADYIAAKQRIYRGCQTPIINHDDPLSYSGLAATTSAIRFTLNEPTAANEFGLSHTAEGVALALGKKVLLPVSALRIKGRHHWANALAALALGQAIDLPLESMLQTLRTFSGLAHRCQWVRQLHGIDWYNDSKATNVVSTIAAIQGLADTIPGKLIVIAGGIGKQQDFSPLKDPIAEKVRTVILLGQDSLLIEQALRGCVKTLNAASMAEAVAMAYHEANSGDAVLLSPACASFDMFTNFEQRGEVFMALVRELQ